MSRFSAACALLLGLVLNLSAGFAWEGQGGSSGASSEATSGLSGVGAAQGLRVVSDISTNKAWVSASFITLTDGTSALTYPSVSVTVDVGASVGANGPDAGSGVDVSDSWVAVWGIGKEDGTFAALASASFTSPTMPTGYTYKLLISALRNNSSSNFFKMHQTGKRVLYEDRTAVGVSAKILTAGTATSLTDVDYSAWAPPGSLGALLYFDGHEAGLYDKRTGGVSSFAYNSAAGQVSVTVGEVPLDANRVFQYKTDGSAMNIYPAGFVMP